VSRSETEVISEDATKAEGSHRWVVSWNSKNLKTNEAINGALYRHTF